MYILYISEHFPVTKKLKVLPFFKDAIYLFSKFKIKLSNEKIYKILLFSLDVTRQIEQN